MRPLSAVELLDVWERGVTHSAVERSLALLAAAHGEESLEGLAQLSIGQRDALLLTLREWTFGPRFVGLATCPACGERLELTVEAADLRAAAAAEVTRELSVQVADYTVRFRLPTSLDVAVCGGGDLEHVRDALLQRCILQIQRDGVETPSEPLPPVVVDAIVARMAEVDPQADVLLALTCPQCGHRWQAGFDIGAYFWCEIDAWAQRTLREVHILASRYGWREMDILAMSARRRQCYLNLVHG